MEKVYIICDFRESFPTKTENGITFNDHPRKESIEEIRNIYCKYGINCEIFGGVPELVEAFQNEATFDNAIFINMSDGLTQQYSRVQIPILCDMLNIKYSGSDPFTVALMTNKHFSKMAVAEINIKCAPGILVTNQSNQDIHKQAEQIGYPIMVKPNTEGSSVGIDSNNVCFNYSDLQKCISKSLNNFSEIVIEKYVPGYEVTDFLIGNPDNFILNEVLIVEHHKKIFFDSEVITLNDNAQKTTSYHMAEEYLNANTIQKIKESTIRVASQINAHDILRIDYRVTAENEIYFLEVNSVPRVSSTSELGFICEHKKLSYEQLLIEYVHVIQTRLMHD